MKKLHYLYLIDTPIEKIENYEGMTELSYFMLGSAPQIKPSEIKKIKQLPEKICKELFK